MAGYAIGGGVAKIFNEERVENLKKLQNYLVDHQKIEPFLIFLFGFMLLNDDFLTILLGSIKCSAKKTIFFC